MAYALGSYLFYAIPMLLMLIQAYVLSSEGITSEDLPFALPVLIAFMLLAPLSVPLVVLFVTRVLWMNYGEAVLMLLTWSLLSVSMVISWLLLGVKSPKRLRFQIAASVIGAVFLFAVLAMCVAIYS